MACRSQQLFLLAGIFGLVLLGKPAKTSASTVEILTSNVEDLAAVSSGGDQAFLPDTNLNSREGLRAAYEFPQLPAESELAALSPTLPLSAPAETPDPSPFAANSATGTFSTKTQETELFNRGQKVEENIDRKKTDLDIDRDSHLSQLPNPNQLPNPILPREPELPAPTAPQPPPSSPLQPTPLTPVPGEATPGIPGTIRVSAFEFEGNTAFSDRELAEVIKEFAGRDITFALKFKARDPNCARNSRCSIAGNRR